jgi:hypothetical protein
MRRDHDGAGGNLIDCGACCSPPFELHRFAASMNWVVLISRGCLAIRLAGCVPRRRPETSLIAREKVRHEAEVGDRF